MPRRKGVRTKAGDAWLKGPVWDFNRKPRPTLEQPVKLVVTASGARLNEPESLIYYALEDMHYNFTAQARLGTAFGGALVDFMIWDYGIALEYQGPWHFGSEGEAKDFIRKVVRELAGFDVKYVYQRDLDDLHHNLRKLIGTRYGIHVQR